MPQTKVSVIGSGFSGLASASLLAKAGCKVEVFEKNSNLGGRARMLNNAGFKFDMGPSWYWMPDVFENFFKLFDKTPQDYYELKRLDPSYRVFFKDDYIDMPASLDEMYALFESIEAGAAAKLKQFLSEAAYKYDVGMNDLVFKPSLNPLEFVKPKVLKGLFECNLFTPMTTYVDNFFKDPRLKQLIEFPVLFLGATAAKTPSLYSLMNYADIYLGTWYPMGGMHEVIKAMCQLAEDHGVKMNLGAPVSKIVTNNKQVSGLEVNNTEFYESDYVVASADYHHVETKLLNSSDRSYTDTYWDTRVMAPSSLIFYVGVQGKLENLEHHNLFFDESLDEHSHEIYEEPCWPTKPLFYVSCTSKTDSTVAPKGCENLFILIPVAPNLQDTEEIRQKYYELIMDRLEKHTKQEIRSKVIFKKSFAHQDFMDDYHAFKGNAYGLANTLMQTALLKPSLKSRKVKNLYFAGQLTVPGPGVPPSLISGQVVSSEILKKIKQNQQQLAGSTN